MSQSSGAAAPRDERLTTGVPHLDEVLGGGLPRGALVLITGLPGSGKTTLASQVAFSAAKAGQQVLILTALSESTAKLTEHLRSFSFYDPQLIGGKVQFFSLQDVIAQGLRETTREVLKEAFRLRANLIVLDGFRGMRGAEQDPQAAREFLYETGTSLGTLNTTTIVTSEMDPRDPNFYPETTTADVILGLHYSIIGVRQRRGVEVVKARGSAPLPGLHTLALGSNGAAVFPQLEERVAKELLGNDAQTLGAASTDVRVQPNVDLTQRVAFELPAFDAMLAGGLPRTTSTLVAGSLGTGKTLLAQYYALAGVHEGETVVFLGFREDRGGLIRGSSAFDIGPEFARALEPGGGLTFIGVPPIKVNPDVIGDRLLNTVDETGATRVVIDSITELEHAVERDGGAGRVEDYLAALLLSLRARGVTSLMIKETDKALGSSLDFSAGVLSLLAENVLLLQQVPFRGELHRIISVLKLRYSAHDTSVHQFHVEAPEGLRMLARSETTPGLLSAIAREQNINPLDTSEGATDRDPDGIEGAGR